MSADHARAIWGYGGPGGSLAGKQPALRTRRAYPVLGDGNSPGIRPYVYGPWPIASDAFGIAYPAGLVAVVTSAGEFGAGSINTQFENYWSNRITSGGGGVIAVPGVLPTGYTPSYQTPWRSDNPVSLGRIMTPTGFTDQTWLPSSAPYGSSWNIAMGSLSIPLPGDGYGQVGGSFATWTGFRNISVQMIYPCASPVVFTPGSATMAVQFSHNANGSYPGNADGSTLDGSCSFVDSDFVFNAGLGGMAGPIKTTGAALATRGTMTAFQMHVSTAFSGGLVAFNIYVSLSPRMDVPYPLTVTGEGALIAPGGTP